ncbi:CDF-like metal transporter [Pyrrhoderma noxium]|uniref:CDF-like metal transporter n=1 Tax=Pyrrhoderma noxium TaxID=2282107 RepID=A0A286UTB6_9AGAM|nr:CDF-like metal transporter [Pyrrhoderma noxium]
MYTITNIISFRLSIKGLDPIGAIIIALGVIISWGHTIYRQFELLAGKSAPYDFLKLITYKAMTFSDTIEKVDTIRAYHSGPEYFVEIDVVMAADTPLWKAHDLSQQLQDKIEVLPNVGRAFVHVDHETTHTRVTDHSLFFILHLLSFTNYYFSFTFYPL